MIIILVFIHNDKYTKTTSTFTKSCIFEKIS